MFPKEATSLPIFCLILISLPGLFPQRHNICTHHPVSRGSEDSFLLWLYFPQRFWPQVSKAGLSLHTQHSLRSRKIYLPSGLSFCRRRRRVLLHEQSPGRGKLECAEGPGQTPQKPACRNWVSPLIYIHGEVIPTNALRSRGPRLLPGHYSLADELSWGRQRRVEARNQVLCSGPIFTWEKPYLEPEMDSKHQLWFPSLALLTPLLKIALWFLTI